jgi:hypothetical protein
VYFSHLFICINIESPLRCLNIYYALNSILDVNNDKSHNEKIFMSEVQSLAQLIIVLEVNHYFLLVCV